MWIVAPHCCKMIGSRAFDQTIIRLVWWDVVCEFPDLYAHLDLFICRSWWSMEVGGVFRSRRKWFCISKDLSKSTTYCEHCWLLRRAIPFAFSPWWWESRTFFRFILWVLKWTQNWTVVSSALFLPLLSPAHTCPIICIPRVLNMPFKPTRKHSCTAAGLLQMMSTTMKTNPDIAYIVTTSCQLLPHDF